MKNVLIIGSIGDFGGREVEVKNIIKALSPIYSVKLFSTFPMTEKSIVFNDVNCQWTTLHKKLNNSNIILKGLSHLSKIINKSNLPSYFLVDNKISRLLFDFDNKNLKIIQKELNNVDAVLFCGTLTSGFLKEITQYCVNSNKPILFRTTGNIIVIPEHLKKTLSKITSIIVHSKFNSLNLLNFAAGNIKIIDQTTLQENDLLKLPLESNGDFKFGYLGRFSPEKGIMELLDSFQQFNKKLVIGGSGPLLKEVKQKCIESPFLQYEGEIAANQISEFFNKIDGLIIPSFEEAGPLVGIEAMAAGKIILSTKVGAMMERLEQTPNQFWFDINDQDSLLNEVSTIEHKNQDQILNIRKQVRDRYIKQYSEKKIAASYLNLFEEAFQNIKTSQL